jgi:hypothetical protein
MEIGHELTQQRLDKASGSGKANCFSPPTNPAAACSNFTAIELVDCPTYGECEVCISPKTSNASFWIGPRWWQAKEGALSRRRRSRSQRAPKYFLGLHAGDRRGFSPYGTIMRPETLYRRVSLVLVTRTQVQPVSLQTRSSPAAGAP